MSRIAQRVSGLVLAAALAGCVADDGSYGYSVGIGYGTPGFGFGYGISDYGYGYGYDPYYYGTYTGSLLFGGAWYDGPHRYRWGRYGREYWYRDGWRRPDRDGQGGNWQDDPPGQGNAGNQPVPRPNPGFFRERNEAAARARAEGNFRGGDRPNAVVDRGNGGGDRPAANADRGNGGAANNAREVPRPGPGQAAARQRAGANREVE